MFKKSRLAVTVAGVALAAMSNAQNFTLNGSAGTIDYTVESVGGANAGGPVFSGYKLITPGHNFKGTGAVQAGIASTAGSLVPSLSLNAAAAPGLDFGGGTCSIFATTFGNPVGIGWPDFTVGSTANTNVASVNYSQVSADYTLHTVGSAYMWGSVFMGLSGHVGAQPGSYVAGSLMGTFNVVGGYTATAYVSIFSDGSGPLADGVDVFVTTSAPGSPNTYQLNMALPSTDDFSGWGYAWATIATAAPDLALCSLDGGLTLIASGDSSIGYAQPPAPPPGYPDPVNRWAPVPEPSSIAALGLGALVLLRRRRRS
jgi:hypothetical protein